MRGRVAVARVAGAVGATGLLAAGAAVGLSAERYVMSRATRVDDPCANEPFGGLRGAPYAIEASDGVELHAEVDGDDAPGLTVLFVHGFALNQDCWHFQRRDLRGWSRLIFYDQRSHGRSGRAPGDETSIRRLGRDLGEVIDLLAPPGPVVVVGHSMGGMTIMSLAEQRPELFGERIRGVALVATSAMMAVGDEVGFVGQTARTVQRLGEAALAAAARQADLVESVRRSGSDLGYALTKRFSFSRRDVSPTLVEFTSAMVASTPVAVLADFIPHFGTLDMRTALRSLGEIETLVVGAGRDEMTPVQHSREIVATVPNARYVEIPDAGHMVMLEYPDLVTAHLRSLVARATRGTDAETEDPGVAPTPLPRPAGRRRPRR